jgi:hypothetical protein
MKLNSRGGALVISVRIGRATFEAVQLDSRDHVRGMGLDPDAIRWLKHGAVITATHDQLIAFADYLDPFCLSEDIPAADKRAIARDRAKLLSGGVTGET